MNTFDQIWTRVVKVGGFLLGAYIMYHEAFYDHNDRPYLYAAALAMMGSQIGETFSKALDVVNDVLATKKKGGISTDSDHNDNGKEIGK